MNILRFFINKSFLLFNWVISNRYVILHKVSLALVAWFIVLCIKCPILRFCPTLINNAYCWFEITGSTILIQIKNLLFNTHYCSDGTEGGGDNSSPQPLDLTNVTLERLDEAIRHKVQPTRTLVRAKSLAITAYTMNPNPSTRLVRDAAIEYHNICSQTVTERLRHRAILYPNAAPFQPDV